MLTIEQIQRRLEAMNLRKVSDASGVAYNTVRRIAGGSVNVEYETVRKLAEYLERLEA